jgi:uncharacterized membrane protein
MNFIHNPIGFVHVLTSIASLVLGTWIIASRKGTKRHKKLGYGYVASMALVNASAFGIYHMLGVFGPFHIAALISSVTLIAGIVPAIRRKPKENWIMKHFTYMYYSVIGLYAAFASEVIVRVPGIRFWWSVMGATFIIIFVGVYFFKNQSKKWAAQFTRAQPS